MRRSFTLITNGLRIDGVLEQLKPGFWTRGTYRVVILINGVEFAEGSFVIE